VGGGGGGGGDGWEWDGGAFERSPPFRPAERASIKGSSRLSRTHGAESSAHPLRCNGGHQSRACLHEQLVDFALEERVHEFVAVPAANPNPKPNPIGRAGSAVRIHSHQASHGVPSRRRTHERARAEAAEHRSRTRPLPGLARSKQRTTERRTRHARYEIAAAHVADGSSFISFCDCSIGSS
jgi:hypothetical protein